MRAPGAICLALAFCFTTGCAATRVVRLDTGAGSPRIHMPGEHEDTSPVELSEDEFVEAVALLAHDVRPSSHPLKAARERFGIPERHGVYVYEGRGPRLIPQQTGPSFESTRLLEAYSDDDVTRAYGRWCAHRSQPGDCLRLLSDGPLLASDGKYSVAMAIAMDSVWEETAEALEDMANPQALMATVSASITMYLVLWTLPEPVSKGVAAMMTATLIAYLGVDTVWRLLEGWRLLAREVDQATTFEQLHAAGDAYGEVLGENAARVFVMLATAAIGRTAGLTAKAPRLPGSAQAVLTVEAQAGYRYAALGGVQSVAMTAEGFTVALAPNALAMANQGMRGGSSDRSQNHHLATDKNSISTARGGPWTPEFKRIFEKAGMKLKDPENIVAVPGHKGPHPQEYHEAVYERLRDATRRCRTMAACRASLTATLKELAEEVSTKGTSLHRLVTLGK